MQLNTDSKQKKPKARQYTLELRVMALTCTKTGIMLPLDEHAVVVANHPHLSRAVELIDDRAEDAEELMQKRMRTIVRNIINNIPLQEVTLPTPNQNCAHEIMLDQKKPEKIARVFNIMLLRAEVEDVPNYVHIPYEDLETSERLCPNMREIFKQLNHFGSLEDFIDSYEGDEG